MKNNSILLLQQIDIIIKEKSILISFHKVKGHSGDKWNDIANELAKEELSNSHVHHPIFEQSNSTIGMTNSCIVGSKC